MPGGLSRSGYSAAAILELLFLNNTNVRKGSEEEERRGEEDVLEIPASVEFIIIATHSQ